MNGENFLFSSFFLSTPDAIKDSILLCLITHDSCPGISVDGRDASPDLEL